MPKINDVVMGEVEADLEIIQSGKTTDPDEFYAKNAFRIIYQTNNFFLPQIKDIIDKAEIINLRPEYQRRLRWSAVQKSRLIESLLLNIPVPPIFLFETDAARYEVMDGQQRLNAVKEFLAGEFALTSLQVLTPLAGLRYSKCPPRIKRTLDRASLSAIVLLLESASENKENQLTIADIRRVIFDRLNTGGTKLNPQEIRNAINPGAFNKVLMNLTRFDLFTKAFGIPPYVESDPNDYYENPARQSNALFASMGDCQLVLRYFALREEKDIRGSMRAMLDRAMETRVKISQDEANDLEQEYIERFTFLFNLFDKEPFLLAPDEKGRVRVSAAIYDGLMVALNKAWGHKAEIWSDRVGVKQRMHEALQNGKQVAILTGQGNTSQAVRDRINLLGEILMPRV
jgi:Protein of unknown function DUF262